MFTTAVRFVTALVLVVAANVGSAGTAAADGHCQGIGNGDFCMNVETTSEESARVSMWYRKDFGEPVTVRFAFWYYAGDTTHSSWQPVTTGEVASWQAVAARSCVYGKIEVQGGPVFYLEKNPVCPGK